MSHRVAQRRLHDADSFRDIIAGGRKASKRPSSWPLAPIRLLLLFDAHFNRASCSSSSLPLLSPNNQKLTSLAPPLGDQVGVLVLVHDVVDGVGVLDLEVVELAPAPSGRSGSGGGAGRGISSGSSGSVIVAASSQARQGRQRCGAALGGALATGSSLHSCCRSLVVCVKREGTPSLFRFASKS